MPHFGDKNIICKINKDGGHFGSTENEFAWLEFLMLNPKDDKWLNSLFILNTLFFNTDFYYLLLYL